MRERLKRVVLKTTVRETVPGVRIPLPPPLFVLSLLEDDVEGLSISGTETYALQFESTIFSNWARSASFCLRYRE
jgi:hypothetical protein